MPRSCPVLCLLSPSLHLVHCTHRVGVSALLAAAAGPYKVNGVPLRRVNQRYVIATSTKVDVTGVAVPDTVNDAFFKRPATKSKTTEGEFFSTEAEVRARAACGARGRQGSTLVLCGRSLAACFGWPPWKPLVLRCEWSLAACCLCRLVWQPCKPAQRSHGDARACRWWVRCLTRSCVLFMRYRLP